MSFLPQSKKSKYPSFSDPYADVVLETCDKIWFPVSKTILSITSPFFEQMFTLPQSEDYKDPQNTVPPNQDQVTLKSGRKVPIVEVSEDSGTLDHLLRIVYPFSARKLRADNDTEVKLADKVLSSAMKYDIPVAIEEIWPILLSVAISSSSASAPSKALRLYVIACRHSNEMARDAARACLHGKIHGVYIEELENLATGKYFRLLEYRNTVEQRVIALVDSLSGPLHLDAYGCRVCNRDGQAYGYNRDIPKTPGWLKTFVEKASPLLRIAPLTEDIYSPSILSQVVATASGCTSCRIMIDGKWLSLERTLRQQFADVALQVRPLWN